MLAVVRAEDVLKCYEGGVGDMGVVESNCPNAKNCFTIVIGKISRHLIINAYAWIIN